MNSELGEIWEGSKTLQGKLMHLLERLPIKHRHKSISYITQTVHIRPYTYMRVKPFPNWRNFVKDVW